MATDPVYHYTSPAGLLSILKNKRLWASEASGMNDLAEVRSGWERIRAWLERQAKSDAVELLRDLAEAPLDNPHEVFVLCGSTAADDANQWRLYAGGGSGYAIGLDPSVDLIAVSDVPALEPPHKRARSVRHLRSRRPAPPRKLTWDVLLRDSVTVTPWLHVMYKDSEAVLALEELVDWADTEFRAMSSGMPDDIAAEEYQTLQSKAYDALATIAHLIKAPGFSGENEVRVVATYLWSSANVLYRAGQYGVVGYAELTAGLDGRSVRVLRPAAKGRLPDLSLPVKSVRLGPLLHAENSTTIRGLLDSSGFKGADVLESEVPLR